jgi:WD40 repeat protein
MSVYTRSLSLRQFQSRSHFVPHVPLALVLHEEGASPVFRFKKSGLILLVSICVGRQFEYHPNLPWLAIGTCDAEVVIADWDSNQVLANSVFPDATPQESVLALAWLKKQPHLLLAASCSGRANLYSTSSSNGCTLELKHSYSDLALNLTSVHSNSDDTLLVASGDNNDVGVHDLSTGSIVRTYTNVHTQHINIARFANHMPNLLCSCSFDRTIKMWDVRVNLAAPIYTLTSDGGNVIVTFAPDDRCLLASAIDNEVKQYCVRPCLHSSDRRWAMTCWG